jgi:hypothetical protein
MIALSLMALVLLIVLSITTLVQVEVQSAQIQLHRLQAREGARLALTLAIGQLQEYASNDKRITARAELLGSDRIHPDTRFWTGVWDTENMDSAPVWLVSGANAVVDKAPVDPMRLVGPGTTGEDTSQYVHVPTIEIPDSSGTMLNRIGWWISDEGVKASVASLPLHERPTADIQKRDSAQLQLATTHGLEAIFDKYDRFSTSSAKALDRISSIEQMNTFEEFNEDTLANIKKTFFHTLTPNSYGVLASTTDGGLMQDLSLFPALLGSGLENYLKLGETHADLLAKQTDPIAQKLLFTGIVGLEEIGALQDGKIATPIIPVLSNFMIAFTIRSRKAPDAGENFLLRSRFFCEFWNPYTHTLSMVDRAGDPVDLELEITGFPTVTVHSSSNSSNPINLQEVMGDTKHKDNAVVIRLVNDSKEPWLPGRSKNWVGLRRTADPVHSPYESVDTRTKRWPLNDRALGDAEGIDAGKPCFKGNIYHKSSGTHELRIKVYTVTSDDRKLVSDLNGFLYESVDTSSHEQQHDHLGMTFGYHINLREPHHSNNESEFHRGRWLKDHDPRSPLPKIQKDWYTPENTHLTGSPYIPVRDGYVAINTPEPHIINTVGNSINAVSPRRLLDRSKNGSSLYDLWKDAPLFELPRRRILSLASLQHVYMHNERPFQVGNSWGNQGRHNTSEWFDRYFFSGFSQSDKAGDFDRQTGPANPCLQFVNIDSFQARFPLWSKGKADNAAITREPALHFLVANRFNINSTSVDAWKAVLSSLRFEEFNHLSWPDGTSEDPDTLELSQGSHRQGSFARFSHSLEETYQAPASPTKDDTAPSAFYRHGARRFSSKEFEILAHEIVRLIREKGTPFKSMEEFLSELSAGNGSLLEQAIKNVLTDPITKRQQWHHNWEITGKGHKNDETPIAIDHFSPGFLTQADIMTAIGPMLAPRSDTFKIRARSECVNDLGKPIGSATIEAVLQRVPEATDPSTPLDKSSDRKLKVISIRWLTDDEI